MFRNFDKNSFLPDGRITDQSADLPIDRPVLPVESLLYIFQDFPSPLRPKLKIPNHPTLSTESRVF